MSSDTPPEVKPQVANLADILKWVQQGKLRLPHFQRPFRWDRKRMCDLFDSVYKQYPIGTLLIWVSQEKRPSRSTLGPLTLPSPPASGELLLIDGQQRVAVIAGTMLLGRLEQAPDIEDKGAWEIWFDADDKDKGFKHLGAEPAPPSCIRVRDLFDLNAILEASAALSATVEDTGKRRAIVARWQDAATQLGSYRLPYVEFHTDDLSLAVESFTRLNRRGLDVSADEMFSALSGDDGGVRLSDHIDVTLRAISDAGFGELDRLTILRLILLNLDQDPFKADWDRLNEETRTGIKTELDKVAHRSRGALLQALTLLRDELTLVSTRLLPYSGILVGVAAFLGSQERSTEDRGRLRAWCWHAAFAGFAEGNPSRATKVWKALRSAAANSSEPLPLVSPNAAATPFPSRYDLRTARLQSNLWATLHAWQPDHAERVRLANFLNNFGPQAYRRVCDPRRSTKSPRLKELLSSPANRVFDLWGLQSNQPSIGAAASDILALDPSRDRGWLIRLQIGDDALERLRQKDEEGFLRLRLERMIQDERKQMELFGLTPPAELRPQPAAIDHEEQLGLFDADDEDAAFERLQAQHDQREQSAARALSSRPSADQLVDWFLTFYKDPADGVPYDGREGGYQYIYGGPWDADDVLHTTFPNADDETLQEALVVIHRQGWEWVKSSLY